VCFVSSCIFTLHISAAQRPALLAQKHWPN
jgi:hypothetical protein